MMQKKRMKMTSNEDQHGRVQMVIKNFCILVIWTKVALAFEV